MTHLQRGFQEAQASPHDRLQGRGLECRGVAVAVPAASHVHLRPPIQHGMVGIVVHLHRLPSHGGEGLGVEEARLALAALASGQGLRAEGLVMMGWDESWRAGMSHGGQQGERVQGWRAGKMQGCKPSKPQRLHGAQCLPTAWLQQGNP